MFDSFRINPAIVLNPFSDDAIQIRLPNAGHTSIEFSPEIVRRVLGSGAVDDRNGWLERISAGGVAPGDAGDFFEMLLSIGAFVDGRREIMTGLDALIAHEDISTKSVRSTFEPPLVRRIALVGDGQLRDAAESVLGAAGHYDIAARGASFAQADLSIVFCDREDFAAMAAAWKDAPAACFGLTCWCDQMSIRIGPLGIGGESACFECLMARLDAASYFPEEFESLRNGNARPVSRLPIAAGSMKIFEFAIDRSVRLIDDGLFHILEPGSVESWNLLSGAKTVQRVLRNPYCHACAGGAAAKRAVRDMI